MYFDEDFYGDEKKEEFVITYADLIKFEKFKMAHPSYISDLHSGTKILYETYICMYDNKNFSDKPQHFEVACRIGFGMLMRHILETITEYLIVESVIDLDESKTVYDKLVALNQQHSLHYNAKTNKILMDTLDFTNEIAHPHIISSKITSYKQLREFYFNSFRPLIESHISSKALHKYSRRDKKLTDKYILELIQRLDSFNIKDKTTSILIKGCLVRHLTECAVNYHSFNNNLVPTDASTQEDQISISGNLTKLSALAKMNKSSMDNNYPINQDIITNLFKLKNNSNNIMHENDYSISSFSYFNESLAEVYFTVIDECTPNIIIPEQTIKYPVYKPVIITTLLCGFSGWFGTHHFYSGNIAKGIFMLFFNVLGFCFVKGFLTMPLMNGIGKFIPAVFAVLWFIATISTILSLNKIRTGEFETSKWGVLPKRKLTSFLSVLFIIIHIFIKINFL